VKLLFDTHVLWWVLNDPAQLPPRVRAAVADPRATLLCSSVTPWEIATKLRLGNFPGAATLVESFPEQLARLGASELPILNSHGLLAGRLEWRHRDPFDRMLAAQSLIEGAKLVTSDRAFATLPGVDIFW
jgi:PIN domain nuclease of toxin-antitoxin system